MSRDNKKNNESTSNDKTIYINRVSKVVKGGRRFNFTAMVVTGDAENNKVGVGFGKASQVPEAIRKVSDKARASMVSTPVVEGTVPHIVTGKFGASKVLLRLVSPWYRCYRIIYRTFHFGCSWLHQCSHQGDWFKQCTQCRESNIECVVSP